MKCKNCGANLEEKGGKYFCPFCNAIFLKEEIVPLYNKAQKIKPSEFNVQNGVLISYNGREQRVVIPDGIYSIGREAFKNNLTVQSVSFSNTVTVVESGAFSGCENLSVIENTENIAYYKSECFRGAGLKEVVVGENVVQLGNNCFSYMPNLTKVIYKPQKDMPLDHTFSCCERLTTVETDSEYFFPAFVPKREVKNNPTNKRSTVFDAFSHTPFLLRLKEEYKESVKKGVCPDCGGQIKNTLFHKKCCGCGIDYKTL